MPHTAHLATYILDCQYKTFEPLSLTQITLQILVRAKPLRMQPTFMEMKPHTTNLTICVLDCQYKTFEPLSLIIVVSQWGSEDAGFVVVQSFL